MAYTPELDREVSGFLRRIAWALRIPMTVTLEDVVLNVAERTDPEKVCPFCQDRSRCSECFLKRSPRPSGNRLAEVLRKD